MLQGACWGLGQWTRWQTLIQMVIMIHMPRRMFAYLMSALWQLACQKMNTWQSQKCVTVMRWKPFVTKQLGSSLIQSPNSWWQKKYIIDTQLIDFLNGSMLFDELVINSDNNMLSMKVIERAKLIITYFNCLIIYPDIVFSFYRHFWQMNRWYCMWYCRDPHYGIRFLKRVKLFSEFQLITASLKESC